MREHNTSNDAHTSLSGMHWLLYAYSYLFLFQEIQTEDGGVRGHTAPVPNQDPSSPHSLPKARTCILNLGLILLCLPWKGRDLARN